MSSQPYRRRKHPAWRLAAAHVVNRCIIYRLVSPHWWHLNSIGFKAQGLGLWVWGLGLGMRVVMRFVA